MLQDQLAKELGISKGYLSKLIAKGCPADDVGKAKNWIGGNVKGKVGQRLSARDPASTDIPPAESPLPDESFTWEARLARARKVEVDVYNACQTAIGRKEYVPLQSLLASYTKSFQSIAEAEKTALDARIKSGELIHRDTARAILVELACQERLRPSPHDRTQ